MHHLHWLMFALASIGWKSTAQNCSDEDYITAYDVLFEQLNLGDVQKNQNRPFISETFTIIFVDLIVSSITGVNEKAQSLSTQITLNTAWVNRKMEWNPKEFCSAFSISARRDALWTPDIGILEGIDTEFGTKESPYVQLFFFGFTVSSEVLAVTTACKMDLYRFPFDIQSCNLTLQSTVYSDFEFVIMPITDAEGITLQSKETFQAQGEWELLNIENTYSFGHVLWDRKTQLIYKITIGRRPLLYVINIIVPVFFFLVLDVISFFIEASGADKLSFKVTLLLSISVLLLIVNDTLPSTADKIPLIGIYCSVIFILIGISILETILVNFLMSRGVEGRSVKTTPVNGRHDGVRDLQIPPSSIGDQNREQFCTFELLKQIHTEWAATQQNQKTSLFWTKVARIIDVTFIILYIITIIVFLSILGKLWSP